MDITDAIIRYRRYLKRRNYSGHTVRNYMNMLKHYVVWLDVPLQEATPEKVTAYIDHLLHKRLKQRIPIVSGLGQIFVPIPGGIWLQDGRNGRQTWPIGMPISVIAVREFMEKYSLQRRFPQHSAAMTQ